MEVAVRRNIWREQVSRTGFFCGTAPRGDQGVRRVVVKRDTMTGREWDLAKVESKGSSGVV